MFYVFCAMYCITIKSARKKKNSFQIVSDHQFSNVFTEKKMCVSGPEQFKPVLFKGQMYFFKFHVAWPLVIGFTNSFEKYVNGPAALQIKFSF